MHTFELSNTLLLDSKACIHLCWWRRRKKKQHVNKSCDGPPRGNDPSLSFPQDSLAVMIHLLTYLNRNHFLSSVHASQKISKIHLYLFEVLLPGDMLLGCHTVLIWCTEFYVNCGNPLNASSLLSSTGRGYKNMIVLFLKATAAGLPIVMYCHSCNLIYKKSAGDRKR